MFGEVPVSREVPGPPSYLRPVEPKKAVAGKDARVLLKQRDEELRQANGRISKGRSAWWAMRKRLRN